MVRPFKNHFKNHLMLISETQFRIHKLTIISDREFEEFDEC